MDLVSNQDSYLYFFFRSSSRSLILFIFRLLQIDILMSIIRFWFGIFPPESEVFE